MDDEEQRFTAIYEATRSRVWTYVVSRAGQAVADEVVSDTFMVAWRRFDDIPDPPLPWLLGIARNRLRENVRADVRRSSLVGELSHWAGDRTEDVGTAVVDRMETLRALTSLDEDDRELLVLTAWHGLSSAEIARVVGCSSTAARVRLHRARKRFERALETTPAHRRITTLITEKS
jgi:RNA polymerase sigma-70 factor, ECF subfamily